MVNQILYPKKLDFNLYNKNNSLLETKYGLPKEVLFCKKCIVSNQQPTSAIEYKHCKTSIKRAIAFNENGVCDACLFTEKKRNQIDWQKREYDLNELCNKFRSRNGSYDCLVPGSGGKDSFYTAHVLRYKYNMNPLTVTWAPHIYTDWGWKNYQAWIHAGFDNYLMTPNGKAHRLLTRLAVDNLLHPFQPFILGQKFLAPKMAALFNIPLVFFGENEAEYGNPILDAEKPQRDAVYFSNFAEEDVFLGGTSIAELKENFYLTQQDLIPYLPMNYQIVLEKRIQVTYLGYYLKWHPQGCYYYSVEHGDFQAAPERTPGTYSKYNSIDDKIDDFHYYTTGIKFGIGRATYDASQEIRSGDITREEGVALVKKFDHEFPERFADEIFKYLSISKEDFPKASKMFENPIMDKEYFNLLSDHFRSPHLWYFENGNWKLRHAVWHKDIQNPTLVNA